MEKWVKHRWRAIYGCLPFTLEFWMIRQWQLQVDLCDGTNIIFVTNICLNQWRTIPMPLTWLNWSVAINEGKIDHCQSCFCSHKVSQAGISNCIPQFSVGCNYLSLPEVPASDWQQGPHILSDIRTWVMNHNSPFLVTLNTDLLIHALITFDARVCMSKHTQ